MFDQTTLVSGAMAGAVVKILNNFTASGGNWGTITHVAIFNASTGGQVLAAGALTSSKVISNGDSLQIASGNLTVTLA